MHQNSFVNKVLIPGSAFGPILYSDIGISFWGGIDPLTGHIIDSYHPLFGQCVRDKILVIPSGRGSCTGSCVLLELIMNGCAPAGLIFSQNEDILPLGVIIAEEFFNRSLPVVKVNQDCFNRLKEHPYLRIENNAVSSSNEKGDIREDLTISLFSLSSSQLNLSENDSNILNGTHGLAAQMAMKIIVRMAKLYDAPNLIDVTQAHIDACIYIGPWGLKFIQNLCEFGAKIRIPTTLNAISIDRSNWQQQGLAKEFGEPAQQLADAYIQMGAKPSYTCAPYLLNSAPSLGEKIAWAESNAVVYANSVLGARTMKYPDYLDVCVSLTGRAPNSGCYRDEMRCPQLVINVSSIPKPDDSFFPLLGYHIGKLSPNTIPYIKGIGHINPSNDDLKSFGAAFATTSAAPIFHIDDLTPEADLYSELIDELKQINISSNDLRKSWLDLNGAMHDRIDLIAIGNPHVSLGELNMIAEMCQTLMGLRTRKMIITCGRDVYSKADGEGFVEIIKKFGAQFILDTCWCMLNEPIIPPDAQIIMTNSGKYAHYAPALTGRSMRFGSLDDCLKAACGFKIDRAPPLWLGSSEL